jgi:hypothetical protein
MKTTMAKKGTWFRNKLEFVSIIGTKIKPTRSEENPRRE